MKRQIGRVVMDLILAFCGAVVVYEFFVILTWGRIYPIPNWPCLVIGAIAILGILGFGGWGIVTARSFREGLVGGCLLFIGGGFLAGHVIFPIFYLAHGGLLNSYYGQESNTTILLGELILFGIFGLVGIGNAPIDIYKLHKLRRAIEKD